MQQIDAGSFKLPSWKRGSIYNTKKYNTTGDSFLSKFIRFVKAPYYKYVADSYDKWAAIITVLTMILSIITLIMWMFYKFPELKYVDPQGKDLHIINSYYSIQSYIKIGLMGISILLAMLHIRVLFKHNTFKDDIETSTLSLHPVIITN